MDRKVSLRELVADKIVFALLIGVYYWMWARNDWRSVYPSLQYAVDGFTFYDVIARGIRLRKYRKEEPDEMAETNLRRCDALCLKVGAAAIVALGTLVCQFWGPYTYRFMLLMRDPMPRIVVTACGGVVAIGVLVSFFRLMFARREPSCVHPAGERNIEVTLAALSSCARAAAERDDRVMVEHVEARVQGSDDSHVRFKVEAIALDDKDVASLATAMQQRIEEACDTMLGTPGTTARVRFLPSKTTVQTVEVSGE